MITEDNLKKFIDFILIKNPHFISKLTCVGEDDEIMSLLHFDDDRCTKYQIKELSLLPQEVLFELEQKVTLKEIEENYIQFLIKEVQETVESYELINVRGKEFWFHKTTRYNYKPCTIESLNMMHEDYFEEISDFSDFRYKAAVKLSEGLNEILNQTSSHQSSNKLEVKLSVADIALLFRLLDDEELINYKHKTEIYRFISNNLKTENQDQISEASFKNKFLSPDTTSIKNIEILLANLKQSLRKIQ